MFINLLSSIMIFTSLIQVTMALTLLLNSTLISIEIPFFSLFSMEMPISFLLDWTSLSFSATVMIISSVIILFSINYIPKKEHNHFSTLLLMFILSMITLIMSNNIIFMLVGWDGLGFSSYALVIYYQNPSSSASGTITILSNRIGDILILLTIALLMISSNWNFISNKDFPMITLILLSLAACSKSAQFPFSAWLPAAMAAPTPISALVHSSTLVTAGVYLMIRLMDNPHPITMAMIMSLASMTAIYSSISANWEQDMKKIIALSTLSQIAMMMFAISLNSINTAFLHLVTHALFKSTMFMCAGIIIHNSNYQDMRHMASTLNSNPLVYMTLGISSMALMGLPFMSGFFSKDAILEALISSKLYSFMSLLMIASVGMTASYSTRLTLHSSSFTMKSPPNITPHSLSYFNMALMLMTPLCTMMGATIMWANSPEQVFIIPSHLMILIPLTLLTGAILGLTLSFKSKNYSILGEPVLSLMFIHFMSTLPLQKPTTPMSLLMKQDMSWQEMMGPSGTNSLIKSLSSTPDIIMSILMITLMMTSITLTILLK